MDVNDDEGRLDGRGALSFFASKLAPTYIDNQQVPPDGRLWTTFQELP
jgi:hypothetical protein